jgi:hypothetical protein
MCIREPCPGGIFSEYPSSFPEKPSDISIGTSPFPSISPWTFLAGAIGNIVGSIAGGRRGDNRGVEQPITQQMPDLVEMMQREETNRLIRELLKTSRDKKDKFTMELDLRKPDILNSGGDAFSGLL